MLCFATFAQAQPKQLADPDPLLMGRFGAAVAIRGNAVLVTRVSPDLNGRGVAYIFDLASGALLRSYPDPEPSRYGQFGLTAAMNDRWVAIGAPGAQKVYVYDRTAVGQQPRELVDPTPTGTDNFGMALALQADRLVVGAPTDSTAGAQVGQAHVFELSTSKLVATLDDPTPSGADVFGGAIALNGRWLAIAASADATSKGRSGQVHLYDAQSLTLVRTFDDPTPTRFDLFGDSVSIDGDRLLVGATRDRSSPTSDGQVHLFDIVSGALIHTLADPTPVTGERFGNPVRLVGARGYVGAFADDTKGPDAGQVYEYDAGTGGWLRTFDDPDPTTEGFFGFSLDVDGARLVVGVPGDEKGGVETGEVWVFSVAHEGTP